MWWNIQMHLNSGTNRNDTCRTIAKVMSESAFSLMCDALQSTPFTASQEHWAFIATSNYIHKDCHHSLFVMLVKVRKDHYFTYWFHIPLWPISEKPNNIANKTISFVFSVFFGWKKFCDSRKTAIFKFLL
jgi:hypothetical protein